MELAINGGGAGEHEKQQDAGYEWRTSSHCGFCSGFEVPHVQDATLSASAPEVFEVGLRVMTRVIGQRPWRGK
jgi:hypothetical protein